MGAGWCPPGMLGIGIGGTAEKAALLAKEVLMDPIDIYDLIERGPSNRIEEIRIELFEKVNQLGIGAQGLGGLSTVLDVKIKDYPTHAASLPVAMIPNCAATRHAHFELDGSGPALQEPPSLEAWPDITWEAAGARRVNLDTVTREELGQWKTGEASNCRWTSRTASSITWARSTRCATRSWAPPVRPPQRAWTSSRAPCSRRPG
jgi:fumarate hydratase class I